MAMDELQQLTEDVSRLRALRRSNDDEGVREQGDAIYKLIKKQFGDDFSVAAIELALNRARVEEEALSRSDIPDALEGLGLREFTTTEGLRVTTDDVYRGSVSRANAPVVYDQLVRRMMATGLSRDISERSARVDLTWEVSSSDPAVLEALRELPHEQRFRPHHMRISRMVREWVEAGEQVPTGVSWTTYRTTKIKQNREGF